MKKKSILIIVLVFALLISGISVYALSGSKTVGQNQAEINTKVTETSTEIPAIPEKEPEEITESKAENQLVETAYPSQITKFAKDEELTQESIYNRMLNSVDYFDTASVTFTYKSADDKQEHTIVIDTDLRTHKAFQSKTEAFWDPNESYEDHISDGSRVYWYFNNSKTYMDFGPVQIRTAEEDEFLAQTTRHSIGQEDYNYGADVWLHRADLTNASLSSYCLLPENYAFTYLTDFTKWGITGKKEYLGRNCIVIEGSVGTYAEKFGNESFCMYIDEATGILLMLEGYDSDGEVMNFVHVEEIVIDQPEITCANLKEKINFEKYEDYECVD